MYRLPSIALLIGLQAFAQTPAAAPAPPAPGARPPRPPAPTRDPNTPGYVKAKELPDGAVPPASADGNFIIGPTHPAAPEMTVKEDVPHGTVYNFTMESKDSKFFPGVARDTPPPDSPQAYTTHPRPSRARWPSTSRSSTFPARWLR